MDLRRGPKVNLNRGKLLQLKRTVIVWTTVSRVVATKATGGIANDSLVIVHCIQKVS